MCRHKHPPSYHGHTLQCSVNSYRGLLEVIRGWAASRDHAVMSRFYKRDLIQMRMTLRFTVDSLAGAFSGLLVSSILGMDGCAGHKGLRWILCHCLHSSPCFSHCHRWERTDICIRTVVHQSMRMASKSGSDIVLAASHIPLMYLSDNVYRLKK